MIDLQLRIMADKLLQEARSMARERHIGSSDAEFHSKGVGISILLALSGAFGQAASMEHTLERGE